MIIFDLSKNETHHPSANFKKLSKRLRLFSKVQVNKDDLSSKKLKGCELLIIGSPQAPFHDEELRVIKEYVDGGGAIAVFTSEGGEISSNSNLNQFLNEYGISIDSTSVVRSVYHKYLHPKHALICNGVVQPEIGEEKNTPLILGNNNSSKPNKSGHIGGPSFDRRKKPQDWLDCSESLSFVYPNGTALNVEAPALALLSSGSTSYPVDCPVAAAWEGNSARGDHFVRGKQGRLVVVGSSDVFADDWLEKEENLQLFDIFFRFLLRQNISFDPSKGRSDFEERECVPDISSLSNLIKPCLQENDPLPQDYKSLLNDDLFGLRNDFIPDVIDLYRRLNVAYEPLTLVEPHFECPHPPLRLATHQPRMMDPPPPALELFDLDECFSDVRIRLSQLTNELKDESDLELYIEEAGCIIGIDNRGDGSTSGDSAKEILQHVAERIFQHKMRNSFNF